MSKDEIIEILNQHETGLRSQGLLSLYLFGSYACDKAKPNSDVDLYFDRGKDRRLSLIDLIEFQFRLEELLGNCSPHAA